jgi:hypothetical protein
VDKPNPPYILTPEYLKGFVDDFNRTVAAIVKKQPFETVELYDHPSHALKAMGDLIEDLHADRSKLRSARNDAQRDCDEMEASLDAMMASHILWQGRNRELQRTVDSLRAEVLMLRAQPSCLPALDFCRRVDLAALRLWAKDLHNLPPLLLFGPPGVGKSLLATALSKILPGRNYLEVEIEDPLVCSRPGRIYTYNIDTVPSIFLDVAQVRLRVDTPLSGDQSLLLKELERDLPYLLWGFQ